MAALPPQQPYPLTGQTIFLRSGKGEDQACKVTAYDGTTKIATTCKNWDVIPDSTTAYVILPTGYFDSNELVPIIADGVWNHETGNKVRASVEGKAIITENGDASKTINVYDEDGITVLYTFNVDRYGLERVPA